MWHFMATWTFVPIYDTWHFYLSSTPCWNDACIIVTFTFIFINLLAFICLFLNIYIVQLAIYPLYDIWFALLSECVWIMTWFSTAVTFYFTHLCKWCISDDWNRIICFLCGFLFGILDFISTVVTVPNLTSVVITTMVVHGICSICYIDRILIFLRIILIW